MRTSTFPPDPDAPIMRVCDACALIKCSARTFNRHWRPRLEEFNPHGSRDARFKRDAVLALLEASKVPDVARVLA